MSDRPVVDDLAERRVVRISQWALANVLETMTKEVRPAVRRAYKAKVTDPEACDALVKKFESLAITCREAGRLAREEQRP